MQAHLIIQQEADSLRVDFVVVPLEHQLEQWIPGDHLVLEPILFKGPEAFFEVE